MNPEFLNASYGGLFIALSSIISLAVLGKITGISGIFWQAISNVKEASTPEYSWRWYFIIGLILGPMIVHFVFNFPIPEASPLGFAWVIIAGVLVGFGSNLGSGCTSGHGICGIGRLSKRSLFATATFMSSGILTVYLTGLLL